MLFEDAKRSILEFSPHDYISDVISSLQAVSERISRKNINADAYSDIVMALIDKVAPALASWPQNENEKGCRFFDSILLDGYASIAFREMSASVLSRSDGCEVVARTLVLFVAKQLGGVQRLRSALQATDARDHVTALVHLPERVLNVLYAESEDSFNDGTILREEDYYETLAESIYLQPRAPDLDRDQALSEILRRIVRMKQANTIISCWLSKGNVESITAAIFRTPQSSLEPLVRALLVAKADSCANNERIRHVLCRVVKGSRIACEACISSIPFQRPLLKRPKTALSRLARAVGEAAGKHVLKRALRIAAEKWSDEDFAIAADVQLQRQITRLLLYYLHLTSDLEEYKQIGENAVMMTLVNGVHVRLGQNDVRIRRHGMVIGEASSRHCGDEKPLSFNRKDMTDARQEDARIAGDERIENGGDSDFTELAHNLQDELPDEEIIDGTIQESQKLSSPPETQTMAVQAVRHNHGHDLELNSARRRRRKSSPSRSGLVVTEEEGKWWKDANGNEYEWTNVDDWDSIESFDMTSSSEDETGSLHQRRRKVHRDFEAVRKKISAPMSVARLLGLLREVNKGGSGGLVVNAATTAATLRTIARRAEKSFLQSGTTMHVAGTELIVEVAAVETHRFPDEFMEELGAARRHAMQKLMEMDVAGCGVSVVERIICGPHSSIGKRSECLSMLSAGIRGAQERVKESERQGNEEEDKAMREIEAKAEASRIGTVTKRSRLAGRKKAVAIGSLKAWDDEGLDRVFQSLAQGLVGGGGADFVRLMGRDKQLWAQGIITLGVVASVSGVSEEAQRMRGDVVEIAINEVLASPAEEDSVVRRGCALALGAVMEAMTDAEIQGRVGGRMEIANVREREIFAARRAAEWLEQAATGDRDVGVRRFASRTLRILADRVKQNA